MWSNRLKQPTKRFGISLLIVLTIYAVFAVTWTYKRHKLTPNEQLASFRSTLDQTYLAADQLANFKQSDAVAGSALLQRFTSFQDSVKLLSSTLPKVPDPLLTGQQRRAASAYRDAQNVTIDTFKTSFDAVKQPLLYDPAYDLVTNNTASDAAKLQKRAKTAQAGLSASLAQKTAPSGGLVAQPSQAQTTIIGSASRKLIQDSAVCFATLEGQLAAKQYGAATATKIACVASYPALRQQLLKDVLSSSFTDARETSSQLVAKELLQQIDKQLKKS